VFLSTISGPFLTHGKQLLNGRLNGLCRLKSNEILGTVRLYGFGWHDGRSLINDDSPVHWVEAQKCGILVAARSVLKAWAHNVSPSGIVQNIQRFLLYRV
jgi:hypothetical protein